MPVVKYPRGIPEADETCAVIITQEDRWFYNRFHAAALKKAESDDSEIDPETLMRPSNNYGTRMVIRIYRFDNKNPGDPKRADFELLAFSSPGKDTRMKYVPHSEPPPDCEEIAGGTNESNGTHWTRIAVLLRTIPEPNESEIKNIDEKLFEVSDQ